MDNVETMALAKTKAMADLLATIKPTDLIAVCQLLDWQMGDDKKLPNEKHFKVAIIETLIKTANAKDWHVIHDAEFFYNFNGAFWVALKDVAVKQLPKYAAIAT